jgi:hypothetical protein
MHEKLYIKDLPTTGRCIDFCLNCYVTVHLEENII